MSKNQEQEAKTQESIDKIKQQLDEEYKNLSYLESTWVAIGIETGNKKYDDLNKQYLELNNNNLGIMQVITQAVGDGVSTLQFTWEAAQVLPDLITEYNNLTTVTNATTNTNSIDATCKMIADAEPLIKKCSAIFHSETISDTSKETIIQSTIIPYALTPMLNKGFANITENFQSSEAEKIDILDGVSAKFIRELFTLGVDVVSQALDTDLNPKV